MLHAATTQKTNIYSYTVFHKSVSFWKRLHLNYANAAHKNIIIILKQI
jgi:hypothetical protein